MRLDAAIPAPTDPLLRYSLAELSEIIFAAFAVAGVSTVAEIGAEGGAFTEHLVRWVSERGGGLVSIDPAPSAHVRYLAESSEAVTLLAETSHQVLPRLGAHDAYLLDGDHNYFTVKGELEMIHATCHGADTVPLLVLQDIGWPAGRRDQYYEPEALPEGATRPYDFGGVVPWSDTTFEGGFRGDGNFAFATREGGPANGVRTALEDFLADHAGYEALAVPCVFGLALVFPSSAPWAPELRSQLAVYDDNPLLARLESNRILLYLSVIDLQDRLARQRRRTAAVEAELGAALERARTEVAIANQAARAAAEQRDEAVAEADAARASVPVEGISARRQMLSRALRLPPA
ncbi:MAG TPA: class I SAM-dependent methyltransferase [Acidimicrobiales bacterium]|nr:class I SAM-dependent methyltransferase [Acidimicrobiales bacterium]